MGRDKLYLEMLHELCSISNKRLVYLLMQRAQNRERNEDYGNAALLEAAAMRLKNGQEKTPS